MEGITSVGAMDDENSSKKLVSKSNLIPSLLESNATVIVTIGARMWRNGNNNQKIVK